MATKNDIKFHTEVPERSTEPETPSKRPILKGLIYIAFAFAITYFAKVSPPEYTPSREHGFLSWTFPTSQGISVLWVLADDGIDSNQVKTGHRIWIDPPKHPLEVTENALKLQGRSMTVITRSLEKSMIQELAELLPHQGDLQLWVLGESYNALKDWAQTHQSLSISDSEYVNLRLFEIMQNRNRFQISLTESLELNYTPLAREISFHYGDYHFLHHTGKTSPHSQQEWAMIFWNQAPQDSLEVWTEVNIEQTLISHGKATSVQSERHLVLKSEPTGAVSYEEDGMMHLRKLVLDSWDSQQQ